MNRPMATVFVVDDDRLVRISLDRLLSGAGLTVETFPGGREFLERAPKDSCGCVVLDLSMPEMSGVEVHEELIARDSILPVIFLTGRADVPTTVKAIRNGAAEFLIKPVVRSVLLPAVERAIEKCVRVQQERRGIEEIQRRYATLTSREQQVLLHLLTGKLNKQIAADLGTRLATVKAQRGSLMRKMGANSLPALIWLAERAGITAPFESIAKRAGLTPGVKFDPP